VTNKTFKRGQVVWAVWQFFCHISYDDPRRNLPPPAVFVSRVKKMWGFGVPVSLDERPGTGTTIEYTPYQAFELTVALMLQDMGLKQAEVGQFVFYNRAHLQKGFEKILSNSEPLFLIFRLQEIREGDPFPFPGLPIVEGFNIVPVDGVAEEIKPLRGNGRIILELSQIVECLTVYLEQAPEIRRGRP
jgi:hypothetical protein